MIILVQSIFYFLDVFIILNSHIFIKRLHPKFLIGKNWGNLLIVDWTNVIYLITWITYYTIYGIIFLRFILLERRSPTNCLMISIGWLFIHWNLFRYNLFFFWEVCDLENHFCDIKLWIYCVIIYFQGVMVNDRHCYEVYGYVLIGLYTRFLIQKRPFIYVNGILRFLGF